MSGYSKLVVNLNRNLSSTVRNSFKFSYLEFGGKLTGNWELRGYSASLSEVEFDKRMFRPGYVFLTFSVIADGDVENRQTLQEELKKVFFGQTTFLDLIGVANGILAEACIESDIVYLARNYYFQGYDVKSVKSQEYEVVLKCYSFDRKLTLSKYCRVYTGKRLASGICDGSDGEIEKQLADIKSSVASIIQSESLSNSQTEVKDEGLNAALEENSSNDEKSASDSIYFDAAHPLSNISLTNLLMLGYKETKSGDKVTKAQRTLKENNAELKHPYLVQYNESFYDFVARVAHRCGEFFYFENGKITIGLPESTRSVIFGVKKNDNGTFSVPSSDSILHLSPLCSFSSSGADESRQEVLSFSGDYVNTPSPAIDASKKYFDSEFTSDESLHVVTENDNRFHPFGDWILYKGLGNYFFSDSFLMGIGMAAGLAVWDIINTTLVLPIFSVKPDFKKKHIENGDSVRDVNVLGENASVTAIGAEDIANLCNNHYRLVETWENSSKEKRVSINTESTVCNMYLGDTVILDNLEGGPACVVVSMHGKRSQSGRSYGAEVIPLNFLSNPVGGLHAVVTPVAEEVEHIRKVSSMEALVADTNDPLRLGRVRVRYPWQPKDSADKSPWLRVKVPFAGGGKDYKPGFCMTPSEGEHVMLGYVGGNLDCPFVSGSLFYRSGDGKSDHVPPMGVDVPEGRYYKTDHQIRTIASGKGHALVFKDMENTDLLSQAIPAAGAITQLCQIDKFYKTGKYQANEVFGTIQGGSVTLKDGTGITSVNLSPNTREVTINSILGTVTMNAFTGITINAPNGDVTIKGKNISLEAGNNISIHAGKNIDDSESDLKSTIGGVLGLIGGMAASAGIGVVTGISNTKIFDMSFMRAVFETFLRPVEGTLRLQSNRNTIMTAGKGRVTLTSSLMSQASTWGKKGGDKTKTTFDQLDVNKVNDAAVSQKDYVAIQNFFKACVNEADAFYSSCETAAKAFIIAIGGCGTLFPTSVKSYLATSYKNLNIQKDWLEHLKSNEKALEKNELFNIPEKTDNNRNLILQIEKCYTAYVRDFINAKKAIFGLFQNGDTTKSKYSYKMFTDKFKSFDEGPLVIIKDLEGRDKIKSAIEKQEAEVRGKCFDEDILKFVFLNGHVVFYSYFSEEIARTKKILKKYLVIQTLLNFSKVQIKSPKPVKDYEYNQGGFVTSYDKLKHFVIGEEKNSKWEDFVALIVKTDPKNKDLSTRSTWFKSIFNSFIDTTFGNPKENVKKLLNLDGASGPRSYSDPGGNGTILISSDSGHFVEYNGVRNEWDPKYNPDVSAIKRYIKTIDIEKSSFLLS